MYDPASDVVGARPDPSGIPHCGIYDCMDFESDCRVCHTTISTGATICPADAGEAHPVDALWAAYAAAGPSGDKAVAFRLGVAHYAPGQRTSQDAFPPNRPINIMHLSVFSDGWKSAKAAR